MTSLAVGIVLLVLHIICCVLIYLGIRLHILKVKKHLMPLVIFVPVWGALCVLILHFQIWIRLDDRKIAGVEKMRVNEEIYRSILGNDMETQKEIVPLEEALLINQSGLRRNLIMDVLNDDPNQYIELLQQARLNEDVEVVHYATTAMAEMSKEHDFKLQKLEQAYKQNQDDQDALERYCDFLGEYVEQDMVQGQMKMVQKNQYIRLLKKKLEYGMDFWTCQKLAENQMDLKDYAGAAETLAMMEEKWADRENYWLLKMRFYAQQKRGGELQEVESQIEKRFVYLSSESRERLAFWQQSKGKRV